MDELNIVNWAVESGKPHQANEDDPSPPKPQICRNCGHEVPKLYCTFCGQSLREIRVSFYTLVMDFLGDYFTFDSKLFRSLKPLFFKPGFLTAAFMAGKRVAYIPPLRFYIFSSIIFFLTLTMAARPDQILDGDEPEEPPAIEASESPNPEPEIIAAGMPEKAEPAADGQQEAPTGGNGSQPAVASTDTDNPADSTAEKENRPPPKQSKRKSNVTISNDRFSENTLIGAYLNKKIDNQEKKLEEMEPKEVLRELLIAMFDTVPKALFFLMPIFALFLKLLYVRRDPLYIDHLIFAFHFHAFLFVFYSILIWINLATPMSLAGYTAIAIFLISPIYLFLSLKRVYGQGWIKTFVKFNILSGMYFGALFGFLIFTIILSIFLI